MLDDPGKTPRLLAALKAALPFEVRLTPPLARLLRDEQVALAARDRQMVRATQRCCEERPRGLAAPAPLRPVSKLVVATAIA